MATTDQQDQTECELIAAVARSDMAAFERLYGCYEMRVYRYACSFVRNRATAEEVTVDRLSQNCSARGRGP